jgi:3-carboxy-cis,cis-muconate cycloisomerase
VAPSLTDPLGTTDALSALFSDRSVLQALLDVEAALARVQARLAVIPPSAAAAIEKAAIADAYDAGALARDARHSGTIAVPLVAALTARVRAIDANAAGFVHWGATSQDIVDTAFVRLVDRAIDVIDEDHVALADALRALSDRHAGDVMVARTLLQPAPPITFGLKAAGWYAGVQRSWSRVTTRRREALVIQFGGASGTLAALGLKGLDVAEALAREVRLSCADAPWHGYGDRLAAMVAASAIYTGVLGKMARDISLLMQAEVGEVCEAGGGSSAMPHKQNPTGSVVALAAAARMPGLMSTVLTSLIQEHERGAGSWHAEWPAIVEAVQVMGTAAQAMRIVMSELTVDAARMRANLEATGGAILAELVVMRAAPAVGRDAATTMVKAALERMRQGGTSFGAAVRAMPELAAHLSAEDLRSIDDPGAYLGAAEALRKRLLQQRAGR